MKRRMIGLIAYSWLVFVRNYELLLKNFMAEFITSSSYAIQIWGGERENSKNIIKCTRKQFK